MVSFSCDKCQNVFTKPKVLRHMLSCRTESVSCIDCSVVFDKRSVRAHKACISEAEKYAPKNNSSTECTQTFCGICSLVLNGAVHALQHYESKKHRAAERKLKAAEQRKKEEDKTTMPVRTPAVKEGRMEKSIAQTSESDDLGAKKRKEREEKQQKSLGIKKAMKKVLKKAPKHRLKRDGLIAAMTVLLGKKSPANLPELVDKKASKSTRFMVRKGRISFLSSKQ